MAVQLYITTTVLGLITHSQKSEFH